MKIILTNLDTKEKKHFSLHGITNSLNNDNSDVLNELIDTIKNNPGSYKLEIPDETVVLKMVH